MNNWDGVKAYNRDSIHRGSKSFTFAGYLFEEHVRDDAFALYAWCRHCDDAVDDAKTKKEALEQLNNLRRFTFKALNDFDHELPMPFQSLAYVVQKYDIPMHYPLELLEGMKMDVEDYQYLNRQDLDLYCYRVAGVVGLMMAHIMGVSEQRALNAACSLGKAMQLTNISRDVLDDYKMQRVYIPKSWLETAGLNQSNLFDKSHRDSLVHVVDRLLAWADSNYEEGNAGVRYLNWRCALAIQAASNIYSEIGKVVRKRGASAWDDRVYTSNLTKLWLATKSAIQIVSKTAWQISKPWFPTRRLKVLDNR